MNISRYQVMRQSIVLAGLMLGVEMAGAISPAASQIIPDATLGAERSQVTPNADPSNTDLIEGGALRGRNLFHSFQEFNVNAGQRVYFANPVGVQSIFGRVTGGTVSNILGTLGVSGGANLFLLNPQGFLFGPNATLDIRGSFLATTGDRFLFPDNQAFGINTPTAPLLTVSVPSGVQYGGTPATIRSQGNLAAGQDLTLAAGNLNVEGTVQAGGNLTLQAQDTVTIRDSVTVPFLARSGRDLTIQGNQRVDILALNHLSQTPFVSGGNTTLMSNSPVSADAHFTSGGNFSVRTLTGNLGNLVSLFDPIFNVGGNFDIGDYTGASLQVTAGGNITYGTVVINAIDPAINPIQPTFILAAGSNITGTGAVSTTVTTGQLLVDFRSVGTTTIGNITTQGGDVTMNAQGGITTGAIDTSLTNAVAGTVSITADGDIRANTIQAVGNSANGFSNIALQSNNGSVFLTNADIDTSNLDLSEFSGDITIDAAKNIEIIDSTIQSTGWLGRIFIGSSITPEQVTIANSILSTVSSQSNDSGPISIQGSVVNINTSNIYTNADDGIAGDINIQADASSGTALTLTSTTIDTAAFGQQGKTGSVILNATNRGDITLQDGKIFSDTFGNQLTDGIRVYGGNINIDNYALDATAKSSIAGGNIVIDGYAIILSNQAKLITEVAVTEGTSGNISITGNSLSLAGDSQISAQVNAGVVGDAGNIDLTIQGVTSLVGTNTKIVNSVETGATGNGGVITLKGSGLPVSSGGTTNVQANSLLIQDGASLESSTSGTGNAGNISITAQDVVLQNGNISSSVKDGARGNAGAVEITSDRFSMSSPGSASINTRITGRVDSGGQGNGANITINTRVASIDNSAISFSTSGIGDAGLLTINAQNLTVRSNAAIVGDVGSGGRGRGGSIRFNVTGTLLIDGATDPGVNIAGTGESTRITAGIGPGGSGQGGDVRIQAGTFLMRNGAIIKNSTRGTGNAGDVNITAGQVDISGSVPQSGLPSGLFTSTSNEFKAGDITIQTGTFRIADGSALNAQSLGSGNGGDITVNATNSFTALTGGQLITTTFGAGKAGDIQVTSPTVTIAGRDPFYSARIAKFPNPVDPGVANAITQTGASSGLFANAIGSSTTTGLGVGGDIRVISSKILLQDNAGLRVDSRSTNPTANTENSAGKIEISTNQLKLDNNAFITAETSSGNGGDINIFARDFLLMRRNSLISTTAGTEQQGGSGGTITITAVKGFIVAVPSENSDIIANAFGGNGGKITLSANRIFGLTQRSRLSPSQLREIRNNGTSDISASSDVGADGSISIRTLQIDPSQGLAEIPVEFVDPSGLISQGCQPGQGAIANRGKYVVTGRGGLPLTPEDAMSSMDGSVAWVSHPGAKGTTTPSASTAPVQPLATDQPLVEAQGIAIAADGTAFLTAQSATVTPHTTNFPKVVCPPAQAVVPR